MNDLLHLHYYLGIEVAQHPKYILISKKKYVGELLNRFCMTECNPLSTPMEQKLKFASSEGKEFEDATKYRQVVGSDPRNQTKTGKQTGSKNQLSKNP